MNQDINYEDIVAARGRSRVLCIDYGDKRIGLALSDINWIISSPYSVVESRTGFQKIKSIVDENNISVILIGLPITLGGEEGGKQLEKVKKFAAKCQNELCSVVLWDERLSTSAMLHVCKEIGMSNNKRKQNIDMLSASFILDGWLQYINNTFPKCTDARS